MARLMMTRFLMFGEVTEQMRLRKHWRLARLREQGHVPEAVQIGRYYAIREDMVDAVKDRLVKAGRGRQAEGPAPARQV